MWGIKEEMNVAEKKLVLSCATHWNSVFYMLQRLRWPISALLSDDNVTKRSDRYLDLSNEQWVLAEELVKLLKPFEVATTFLCGEAQSIVSSTLPIIHGLTEYLEPDDADSQPIATFKQVVRDDIRIYIYRNTCVCICDYIYSSTCVCICHIQ